MAPFLSSSNAVTTEIFKCDYKKINLTINMRSRTELKIWYKLYNWAAFIVIHKSQRGRVKLFNKLQGYMQLLRPFARSAHICPWVRRFYLNSSYFSFSNEFGFACYCLPRSTTCKIFLHTAKSEFFELGTGTDGPGSKIFRKNGAGPDLKSGIYDCKYPVCTDSIIGAPLDPKM